MSQPTDAEIDKVKDDIIIGLTGDPRLLKIEQCWDMMLILLVKAGTEQLPPSPSPPPQAFIDLLLMTFDYFLPFGDDSGLTSDTFSSNFKGFLSDSFKTYLKDLIPSDILAQLESKSLKKSEASINWNNIFRCCLGCSQLQLIGWRSVIELWRVNHPFGFIRNIEYADAFWDWFIERTDIDKINGKILSDLEYGGKFPINYDGNVGLVSQIMINEINKGMSSRRKQRTGKSLKSIGMRIDNDYCGLRTSDMQITPGMSIVLQLIAKIEDFYNYRKVVQTIEAIGGQRISQQTIGSIRVSVDLLRRASEKFRYGTNVHNTFASIVWKIAGFWLLFVTSKQIGLSQNRIEDLTDAARNTLILNRIGNPADKSKAKIYIDCANDLRNFILHILSVGESYWNTDKNIQIFLDLEESRIERFIANFKEATGIDLTDKKWLKDEAVVSHDLPNKL